MSKSVLATVAVLAVMTLGGTYAAMRMYDVPYTPGSGCCANKTQAVATECPGTCCDGPTCCQDNPASIIVGGGSCCAAEPAPTAPVADVKPVAATKGGIVITVKDMDCPSCAKKIIAKLKAVEGVVDAVADCDKGTLAVSAKAKATPSAKAMWEAVEKAGFSVTTLECAAGKFTATPKE